MPAMTRWCPPDNSRDFHAALLAHHVASDYLELPSGGHGLNGYKGPMWTAWQERSLDLAGQPAPDPGCGAGRCARCWRRTASRP
jgi:hypothetical protein